MNTFLFVRLSGIECCVWSLRIVRDAALIRYCLVVIRAIPVAAPFPNIPGHIVQAVTIWRKGFHWGNADETVFASIFHRKFSLPRVGHPFSLGTKFIAPDICLA